MSVRYRKAKDKSVLKQLQTVLRLEAAQNYSPLYTRFFAMNETNWNNVNLETDWWLQSITDASGVVTVGNAEGEQREVQCFVKYSPLLDPNRYMSGGYHDANVLQMPSFNDSSVFPKLAEANNSAYVDGFFYFLSSQLKKTRPHFVHSIEFYGNFLGLKKDFEYNLDDEYILHTTFFQTNHGKLFLAESNPDAMNHPDSRHHVVPLETEEGAVVLDGVEEVIVVAAAQCEEVPCEELCEFEPPLEVSSTEVVASQDNNSDSSNTDDEEGEDVWSEFDDDDDMYEPQRITITTFPVQTIFMERCVATLDSLLEKITPDELASALLQIIFTLMVYQAEYEFTHNDLHTNNVMYVATTEPFLYYSVGKQTYKVPTYGRIYKIIDFGRSIYKFKGQRFMSDSFHCQGDAAGQYNTEPFYDASKPRLEPNYSFDLCRLACSMVDVLPETDEFKELIDVVEDWCTDDKGKNVVYKANGEERYPNFKLYKMIARTVHAHTPEAQLDRLVFQRFAISKKQAKGASAIIVVKP